MTPCIILCACTEAISSCCYSLLASTAQSAESLQPAIQCTLRLLFGKSACDEQRTYLMNPTCHVPAMQDYYSVSLRKGHANLLCVVPTLTDVTEVTMAVQHLNRLTAHARQGLTQFCPSHCEKPEATCEILYEHANIYTYKYTA